ncbi:MAG: hypothetical protein ABJM11_00820 [Marinobacter sp.]|uniref:hypothetical protein n=1 Tax=Marinobacter sp. TaxID=50741 RepID=UPI00329937FD
MSTEQPLPKAVSVEEWQAALDPLRVKEKELTRSPGENHPVQITYGVENSLALVLRERLH